jgi:hypothetical protein
MFNGRPFKQHEDNGLAGFYNRFEKFLFPSWEVKQGAGRCLAAHILRFPEDQDRDIGAFGKLNGFRHLGVCLLNGPWLGRFRTEEIGEGGWKLASDLNTRGVVKVHAGNSVPQPIENGDTFIDVVGECPGTGDVVPGIGKRTDNRDLLVGIRLERQNIAFIL